MTTQDQIKLEKKALADFSSAMERIHTSLAGVDTHLSEAGGFKGGYDYYACPEMEQLHNFYRDHHTHASSNITAIRTTVANLKKAADDLHGAYRGAGDDEELSVQQVKDAFARAGTQSAHNQNQNQA